MKTIWTRYLNEIVGLTVMALMIIALVAGQAEATSTEIASRAEHHVIEVRLTLFD